MANLEKITPLLKDKRFGTGSIFDYSVGEHGETVLTPRCALGALIATVVPKDEWDSRMLAGGNYDEQFPELFTEFDLTDDEIGTIWSTNDQSSGDGNKVIEALKS